MMRYFPLIAATTVFAIGLGVGLLARRTIGRHWFALAALIVATLVPYVAYQQDLLQHAVGSGASPAAAWAALRVSPLMVLATSLLGWLLAKPLPWLPTLIPFAAFWVSWAVALPRLGSVTPTGSIGLDNVATVWLLVWSFGGCGVLLSYWVRGSKWHQETYNNTLKG